MLATELLERSVGECSPFAFAQRQTSRLLHALQPAPDILFDGQAQSHERSDEAVAANAGEQDASPERQSARLAHKSGVNALAVDKFEGSLISGAANGNISLWDLEQVSDTSADGRGQTLHTPSGTVAKPPKGHNYGITRLSFYPFDSLAFIASSYDYTIKIYDSVTLQTSATFDLETVIYSHAISPIASHLLIACATQRPIVRLVDLRSGSTTHSLAGHAGGAVLSVAWSPKDQNILASGGSDGTVHIWDIRRSVASLGLLDMEDSIGVAGHRAPGGLARPRQRGQAHVGPVNGIVWTDDGRHLVSTGHDERVRVWDMSVGANTLVNFGPVIRNTDIATLSPRLAPCRFTSIGEGILFFPNGREILMCELFEGRILKRLRAQNVQISSTQHYRDGGGQRNVRNRVEDMTWRAHHVELFSAHSDGTIRSWRPRTSIDALVDEAEKVEDGIEPDSESRKRKRQILDDIHREITTPRVTFT